jgi:nitrate reductase gamma subunit
MKAGTLKDKRAMMDFQNIFLTPGMVEMIRGPMVWAAFLIFGVGMVFQCLLMLRMTRKTALPRPMTIKAPAIRTFADRLTGWLVFLQVSILGTEPFVAMISFMFHVCLIMTPLLVLGHNVLLDTSFGFSFISLSQRATDALTFMVLFCGGFFLLRRIFVRRVRAISSPSDFILLAAAQMPFLTGFLAYHDVFDYHVMIILHILSAEILLVMIPFSRFSHMIFFFISRLLIVGQHGRKSARRVWHYQNEGIR